MLGFIKKDLLLVKANLKSLLIIFVVFIILSFQGTYDFNFILPFICVMLFVSTFSYDDYNKWNTYACSLPGGRNSVVLGKYLASFILVLIASVIGFGISYLIGMTKGNVDVLNIFVTLGGTILGVYVVISFMFPLIFKFGSEKGRIFMFVFVFLFVIAGGIITKFVDLNVVLEFVNYIDVYWYVLVPLISIVLIGGSYLLSKKIYLKKEF